MPSPMRANRIITDALVATLQGSRNAGVTEDSHVGESSDPLIAVRVLQASQEEAELTLDRPRLVPSQLFRKSGHPAGLT
jgi:hypothetical protein